MNQNTCSVFLKVSRQIPLNSFCPDIIPVAQAHRWHFGKTYILYQTFVFNVLTFPGEE